MATLEACRWCGVVDALGRHAGDCQHAIEVGLPRLADGEEPIDPAQEDEANAAATKLYEQEQAEPLPTDLRQRFERRRLPASTDLWMSYRDDGDHFDAVIFDSEIDALRHAVREGWQVVALQLGKPLLDQVRE